MQFLTTVNVTAVKLFGTATRGEKIDLESYTFEGTSSSISSTLSHLYFSKNVIRVRKKWWYVMQTVFKVFSTWWNALQEKWSRCWWTVNSSPLACPASSTSRGSFSTALLVKLSRCNTEENRCHEQYSRWLKSAFRTECRSFFWYKIFFRMLTS